MVLNEVIIYVGISLNCVFEIDVIGGVQSIEICDLKGFWGDVDLEIGWCEGCNGKIVFIDGDGIIILIVFEKC